MSWISFQKRYGEMINRDAEVRDLVWEVVEKNKKAKEEEEEERRMPVAIMLATRSHEERAYKGFKAQAPSATRKFTNKPVVTE